MEIDSMNKGRKTIKKDQADVFKTIKMIQK